MKLHTGFVAVFAVVLAPLIVADEPPIPIGKQRAEFDISKYRTLIDSDLGIPKPSCSAAQMGVPVRTIEGQLLSHDGKPMFDVAVAINETIGYSSHCYFENFDTTDEQGRVSVDGAIRKNRLVFKNPQGRLWIVRLSNDQQRVRVVWPKAGNVTLLIPKRVAAEGETVTVRTQRYWAGMSTMKYSGIVANGQVVFDDVLPADYYATVRKVIRLGESKLIRDIEIAQLSVRSGEDLTVDCDSTTGTRITGDVTSQDGVQKNLQFLKLGQRYVTIERLKLQYEDVPTTGELLKPANDGFFLSRHLPAGTIAVRHMAQTPAGNNAFATAGDVTLNQWRIETKPGLKQITLSDPPPLKTPKSDVVEVLRAAVQIGGRTRSRPNVLAKNLKELSNRSEAERELLRQLRDPNTTYDTRRAILQILAELTDSPIAVNGILEVAADPPFAREQGSVIAALQKATANLPQIVAAMGGYLSHENPITRASAVRVLGMLPGNTQLSESVSDGDKPRDIDADIHIESRVAELLCGALKDQDELTRMTAADFLGRIAHASSQSALMAAADDPYGPVAVMAGFSAWKISCNPDHALPPMNNVLKREGLKGKWEAAYFMKTVAQKHALPAESQALLKTLAATATKERGRTSYDYEINRAAKAAQQTLSAIDK